MEGGAEVNHMLASRSLGSRSSKLFGHPTFGVTWLSENFQAGHKGVTNTPVSRWWNNLFYGKQVTSIESLQL
ncbi:unnamed protein product [Protopolystoma xenopodis]|uniref:Uncharacterized protein n=1 Tax=Protopolystoma xenopodis TaxID=117903 RepID=A0A448WEL3_9PLAT|nr:unnamed protein product [Protopolystoma xenopodis]